MAGILTAKKKNESNSGLLIQDVSLPPCGEGTQNHDVQPLNTSRRRRLYGGLAMSAPRLIACSAEDRRSSGPEHAPATESH